MKMALTLAYARLRRLGWVVLNSCIFFRYSFITVPYLSSIAEPNVEVTFEWSFFVISLFHLYNIGSKDFAYGIECLRVARRVVEWSCK
jgi:hypothetical protein